jgi:threonine dehydrogenase-like Zn-dependent dehydrogenase
MPLELVATGIRQCEVREYEDREPRPGEVLVRTTLASEKHGTDLQFYRGETPFSNKRFDDEHGLFMPVDVPPGGDFGVRPLGNMAAGIVAQVGPEVDSLQVGDRVYGYLPIRESHTVPAGRVQHAPEGLPDEMLVCLDPAMVAFTGVREAKVTLGETVAVFGLGAIGLMTVQLARLAGATFVVAVEPLALRAELGRQYGADLVLDLAEDRDAGLQIRQATDMAGVDIGIETSGNHTALHHAIRGTRYGGTIMPVAWYHGEALGLALGEEWHFNRQTMVSGARLESVPYRDHPRWDPARVTDTILQLFARGRLSVEGMLQPRVPIEQAAESYRLIDEHPEQTVKLAVEFPGATT